MRLLWNRSRGGEVGRADVAGLGLAAPAAQVGLAPSLALLAPQRVQGLAGRLR